MSKARVAALKVSTNSTGSKARVAALNVSVPTVPGSKARVAALSVTSAGVLSRARVAALAVSSGGAVSATRWIRQGGVLLPLGRDDSTPNLSQWGPYGDLGTYKPGATTSGVPNGSALTAVVGDQLFTTSGTAGSPIVHFRQEYFGIVKLQASYHTFRECYFHGPVSEPPTGGGGLLNCNFGSCRGILVEDSTFRPQVPNDMLDAIYGHHFIARRCDVSATVDGFGISYTGAGDWGTRLEGNYIHGHSYRTSRTQTDGHTHNDGTQIYGGAGTWIVGNNYQSFTDTDAAVSNLPNPYASTGNQVTGQSIAPLPITSNITDIHITDNWIDGGAEGGIHSDWRAASVAGTNFGEIKRNKFGRNQHPVGGVKYTVRLAPEITVDCPLTGPDANIFEDTGLPVTVVRN